MRADEMNTKSYIHLHGPVELDAGQALHIHVPEVQLETQRAAASIRNIKALNQERLHLWEGGGCIACARILAHQLVGHIDDAVSVAVTANRQIGG